MSPPRFAFRIGPRALQRVCPSVTDERAQSLARDLGQAMHEFNIDTPVRAAAFIAQVAHESGEFRFREEIASGSAYEGRRDLGNTQPGDGVRFKGRTFIQVTGRANYAAISKALDHDFIAHPAELAEQTWAARGAAWWWSTHGLNAIADRGNFDAVTQRINGGQNGAADRRKYHARANAVARFLVPARREPASLSLHQGAH